MTFATLSVFIPHNLEDPLSVLCGYHVPMDYRYAFLQNDTSLCARFYRSAKKMKKQWNIEEEKLYVTTVVGIITSVIIIILCVYVLFP